MNKMKKVLIASTLGITSFAFVVGGSIATMQERTDNNQTSNQNRNSNGRRRSNSSSGNMGGNMMNSNMEMNSNSSTDMNSNSTMNMNSNSNMMNSNTTAMSDNPNALDADFAMMAAMGGMAEVEWGKLASDKATDKNVKSYAKKMVKDHTKANKNLMKVAAKKNMTLPTTMSAEQMQVMTNLQQATGAEFDRMYVEMSGVDAHQKMEALFQNQAGNGTDADLKAFAAKTLPTVQMHLQMAREMNGKMSSGGSMNMNSNSMEMKSNSNSNRKSKSKSNSNMNSNSNSNL